LKTVIIFKWNRDPQDARINAEGELAWGSAKMAASDDDPAAMEVAQSISDEQDIIALSVGDGDQSWAAARGASCTYTVPDAKSDPDGVVLASTLVCALENIEDVGCLVIGDSEWNRSVVSALAGMLEMPVIAGVVGAERSDAGLRVTCRRGDADVVMEVQEPALLCVKGLSSEKNVPGMKQVLAGRKKPLDKLDLSALAGTRDSSVQGQGTRLPDTPQATVFDGSDPNKAVQDLLAALHADGLL
jgi:electron transfer flavoprotein beta subunit